MKMKIKKMKPNAILPTLGTDGAAAYDLYACIDEPVTIEPGKSAMIGSGLAMQIPFGMVGLMCARSGLACKRGLRLSNNLAIIDSDYRGEICISLYNDSDVAQVIYPNDRIAQIMFTQYFLYDWEEVDELDSTKRGQGGFGSTGTN
jgi:dUTP pyrophosphatase